MSVTVRPYRPDDRDGFVALCAEMERHWEGATAETAAVQESRIEEAFATFKDMRVLVAELDGAVVGLLTAHPTWPGAHLTTAWWVSEVYVAKSARRDGVGRALMQRFLDETLSGAPEGTRVDIVTDHDNSAAAALYRALGAEENPKLFLRYRAGATVREDA